MLTERSIHKLMKAGPEAQLLGDELLRVREMMSLFAKRARHARAQLQRMCAAIDLTMDL